MSGRADADLHPAFSRPLAVDDVPPEGLDLTISATEAERAALAGEDGLEGLAKLEGNLHVAPWRKGGLAVTGEMHARITQICVVTLDPFDSEIVEPIDVRFAPAEVSGSSKSVPLQTTVGRRHRTPALEDAPMAKPPSEDDDPPDPIVNGQIDVGALVAEFLALGLDPYPRKPGVEFQESQDPAEGDIAESPFSKLQTLKGILPS